MRALARVGGFKCRDERAFKCPRVRAGPMPWQRFGQRIKGAKEVAAWPRVISARERARTKTRWGEKGFLRGKVRPAMGTHIYASPRARRRRPLALLHFLTVVSRDDEVGGGVARSLARSLLGLPPANAPVVYIAVYIYELGTRHFFFHVYFFFSYSTLGLLCVATIGACTL